MAETVGLALGIAGLAGVFNACLEAFSLFHAGQSFARDVEILLTRLDIEKTLLLHWAERVGLVNTRNNHASYDPRLNDSRIHSAIANTLALVLHHLTDSERLRSKYGAIPSSSAVASPSIGLVSSSRMRSFARSYQQVQIRMGLRQESARLSARAKWAIRDREQFSSLINELRVFVQCLNELLPTSETHQRLLVREEIERLAQDVRSLRLVQEASVRDHCDWSDAASIYTDTYQMDSEELQHIEHWRNDILELPQEESSDVNHPSLVLSIRDYDSEAFRYAATGSTETLVQLFESGSVTVTAIDKSGHSLLRYALDELHVENAQLLLEKGSDPNSLERSSLFSLDSNDSCISHLAFLVKKCEQSLFPLFTSPNPLTFSKAHDLQGLLLQHGADTFYTHDGSDSSKDILFSYGICGGDLQGLLPLYLSRCPNINLEMIEPKTGYTRLLAVCSSIYDPYSNKVNAIRSLLQKGANARACCETFGNSALHLALLSARIEVGYPNGSTWAGDSEQLRHVLVCLLRHHAEVDACNQARFTPADVAIGLKCVKSWNNAMQDCGFIEHIIDASSSDDYFSQDLSKQARFDTFWEDYNHFSDWGCHPGSCILRHGRWWAGAWREQCPWWEQYTFGWLSMQKWDIKKIEWVEL